MRFSVREAGLEEWREFTEKSEKATFFHTPEWFQVWGRYMGIKSFPALFEFDDGKKILLPLGIRRKKTYKLFISSPGGTYGGWISTDELSSEHVFSIFEWLKRHYFILRLNPYDELQHRIPAEHDITQVIPLDERFEDIERKWRQSIMRKVRKAEREGVRVKKMEEEKGWREYYGVYLSSLERWGKHATSRYSWKLFEILKDTPGVELWCAEYDGKIVAGAVVVYDRHRAIYWHGASLSEYLHLRPVNLLMFSLIMDARKRGKLYFDFNPSGGHEGVLRFKRSFYPRELPSGIIRREPWWRRFLKG